MKLLSVHNIERVNSRSKDIENENRKRRIELSVNRKPIRFRYDSTIYRGSMMISTIEISFRFQLYLTSIIPLCHYRNKRRSTCNQIRILECGVV